MKCNCIHCKKIESDRDELVALQKEHDILKEENEVMYAYLKQCKTFEPFKNPKCKTAMQAIALNGPKIWVTPATDGLELVESLRAKKEKE